MDSVCRVCIAKTAKNTPLNTKIENSSNLTFFDFLNKCTTINACESDKLPQSLCLICTYNTKTFHSFVKLAEKSDLILKRELKTSTATKTYNDKREISCEKITIKKEKIEVSEGYNMYYMWKKEPKHLFEWRNRLLTSSKHFSSSYDRYELSSSTISADRDYQTDQEPEDFSKEEYLHSQTSKNSTESLCYILDLVKEEPGISESTLSPAFKAESEKLHCNPNGSIEESDETVKEGPSDYESIRRSDRLVDNRGYSCEEITIKNEKIKEEVEDFNNESYCGTDKSSTVSLLYIQDIKKEEPCISENTSIVYFEDGENNERNEFHSNLNHLESRMEEHENILSYIDHQIGSTNEIYSDSQNVTDSQKTKIKNENHIRIEHGRRNQDKDDLLKPRLHRHTESSYKCKECNAVFSDREEFRTHCRKHIYGDKHKCNICGKKFARRQYLYIHVAIHEDKKKYKCSICGKVFKQATARWRHMKVHSGERPFECEFCKKRFGLKDNYKKHLRLHARTHELSDKRHECETCSKRFISKRNLRIHIENHKGIIKKCDQCDKQFKNSEALRRHRKLHTEPKPVKYEQCEICNKQFRSKQYLNFHMENHKGIAKKCDKCDKEFKSSDSLRRHMKRHLQPVKFEKCKICNKKFTTKQTLNFHMENHEGIKKKCDQCDKEFKNSNTLRRHMKLHSGTKPPVKYQKCEICSKKFSTKRYLNFHLENHKGIVKKCDHCGKEFKNSESLRRHIKLHTNPKSFKCENCGKSLSSKESYTRHMEICKPVSIATDETATIEG